MIIVDIGEFKISAINVNKDVLFQDHHLKQNDWFYTIKRNNISDNTFTVFVHNTQSLSKHIDDIINDGRVISNEIIGLTETQINSSDSTYKVMKTMNFFNIYFNNFL